MSGYFPYGFTYPQGFDYDESNPDPVIETLRQRVEFLNKAHDASGLPGHIFAAAMDDFQRHTNFGKDIFWDTVMSSLTPEQLAQVGVALADNVSGAMPRLDFPNAIALFDCRFLSTKEWEHVRRYSIGGSEASTVLGVSHYQTPRSLYYEKKAPVQEPENIGRQHILDYGHYVEDHIVSSFAATLGAIVYPEHRMFAHAEYPFITCNPDGIFMFPDGHLELFEAKTAFRMKRDEWKAGIPDYYEPQPRQYLEVLNDPRLLGGHIGVCLGGDPMDRLCHRYERDAQKGAAQIQQVVAFWNDYIVAGVLPPLSGNMKLDMEAVYKYHPNHEHNVVQNVALPDESEADFCRYFEIQAERKKLGKQIKDAKKTEEDLEKELMAAIPAELTVCTSDNGPSYVLKMSVYKSTRVNSAAAVSCIPPDKYAFLTSVAEKTKEPSLAFSVPKVTKGVA